MTHRRRIWLLLVVSTMSLSARGDEAAKTEPALHQADREHWAYVPPVRPKPPAVTNAAWCRTPIDRFILAKLEAKGLAPAAPADPGTLLRRVTFDLTGLPPTPHEIEAFTAATKRRPASGDQAYRAVVERLLASDAYAERQAQHWLDLARYADTDGYEHDNVRPDAWRYRDWVIGAFRRNMPLDEFIRLQIAGDELKPNEPDAAVATGFLLCGPDMPDLNRQDERRSMLLNELTGTVGSTLLGLQIGCAQCHDHKYEPLSQADFYRLRACFETASFLSKQIKEDDDQKDDGKPDVRRVFNETPGPWPTSRMLVRGDFQSPGLSVDPGFPRVANPMNATVATPPPKPIGSGRRSALAHWLTRGDNPLTPRVLVNRIWQQHFVHGLVRTPSDFGYVGDEPTHPELLDWLAVELVARRWDLKQVHRLMVMSAVYRQAGAPSPAADRDNQLLSHFPRRRLDGEELRDSLLEISGRLNRKSGGPGVMPPLPKELLSAIRKDHWKTSPDEADHRRRSIYLFVRRNLRFPLLDAFDRPDTITSCPERNRSTTAPQALVLLNSDFAVQAATDTAAKLEADHPHNLERQIESLYLACLGRRPTEGEVAEGELLTASNDTGLADLCLALFNLNEFAYVD